MPHLGYRLQAQGRFMAKKRATGFATRLRQLREGAGLTQAQLAEQAGLHLHGLTKLEQGDREPGWSTVLALAEALGVECTAFIQSRTSQHATPQTRRPTK